MKVRVDVRLSPTDAKKLAKLAREMKRTHADTVRVLIDDAHERMGIERADPEPTTNRS